MTDAEIIAIAADRTAANLLRFADGDVEGLAGRPIDPEDVGVVRQIAGAYQHFAAMIRIGIAEEREPEYVGDVLP